VAEIDEWFAEAAGSYVVHAPPTAGTTAFVDHVSGQRDGTTLLVAATTGLARTPPTALEWVSSVVDCSPTESGGAGAVASPADLTGLSIPVSEFLESTEQPVLAFDSVSTLLYYADEAAVFRFLGVLTDHLRRRDGLGLFVLTPSAHGEQTVHTFAQVFDGRIDLERDRVRVETTGGADHPDGWQSWSE
jgi:hypothetical protein